MGTRGGATENDGHHDTQGVTKGNGLQTAKASLLGGGRNKECRRSVQAGPAIECHTAVGRGQLMRSIDCVALENSQCLTDHLHEPCRATGLPGCEPLGGSRTLGKVWGVVDVDEDIVDTDWGKVSDELQGLMESMRHTLHVARVAVTALVSHV